MEIARYSSATQRGRRELKGCNGETLQTNYTSTTLGLNKCPVVAQSQTRLSQATSGAYSFVHCSLAHITFNAPLHYTITHNRVLRYDALPHIASTTWYLQSSLIKGAMRTRWKFVPFDRTGCWELTQLNSSHEKRTKFYDVAEKSSQSGCFSCFSWYLDYLSEVCDKISINVIRTEQSFQLTKPVFCLHGPKTPSQMQWVITESTHWLHIILFSDKSSLSFVHYLRVLPKCATADTDSIPRLFHGMDQPSELEQNIIFSPSTLLPRLKGSPTAWLINIVPPLTPIPNSSKSGLLNSHLRWVVNNFKEGVPMSGTLPNKEPFTHSAKDLKRPCNTYHRLFRIHFGVKCIVPGTYFRKNCWNTFSITGATRDEKTRIITFAPFPLKPTFD